MDPSKLVSVVITTYNRSDALLAVLDGLTCQSDKNIEVIIADDGSNEFHRQQIFDSPLAKNLHVTHVWHPDVGFTVSRARNLAVSASQGEYLVFLDGDCVPEVDFIAQHRALAEQGAFVNGSRVLLSDRLTQRVVSGTQKIVGQTNLFWLQQRLGGQSNKLTGLIRLPGWIRRAQNGFSWKGIRSCNMGIWRHDFVLIDGFDESFVGWGHEDADLVLRLSHLGVRRKNGFCATEVFHLWHSEASRTHESQNSRLVMDRWSSNITRASLGYSQVRKNHDFLVTRLGQRLHE